MGSGVVGFNVLPTRAIFNDLNPHLINFYQAIKEEIITPFIAREYLENEGNLLKHQGENYYYEVRKRFNQKHDPLDFLFLSRAGFNGVMRFNAKGEFNIPFCKKIERFSKSYITKIVNQIGHIYGLLKVYDWQFICGDFESLIIQANQNDFIYCDPPYYGRFADYYQSWQETDEERLSFLLNQTQAKFMVSTWYSNQYRNNPSITKYWGNFYLLKKEHFYHIGAKETNRNSIIEALIINYQSSSQLIDNQNNYQLALNL